MEKPLVSLSRPKTAPPPTASAGGQQTTRQANIAKVVELLQHYEEQPIRLSELCRDADVSERTLRSIFKQMFGVGPNRYLHIRRLHLVRVALSMANPDTESVSQIALRFGFSDSGRMASDYYRLFGEYPKKTLMRMLP
ncbi:AraC family ethanolamine operon transcriptional activator [Pseudomonas corrugata]|uniref:helix-turn-helix transcriptional regulator n=1 Tax=Pseudomonas corrugata TaxID=47879 RepID=UPI00285E7BAA|nr:helix-turn-helix transcriptional regulator [Pseudomonas corrugata]MDR7286416.1 AraC family ethanolamine operon transcriptional activator [Pseudomonas corrugata]